MADAAETLAARRVLIVTQHPYPEHRVVRRNVDHLAAEGALVDVVCLRSRASVAPSTPAVRVFPVPLRHKRDSVLRYPFEYATFFCAAAVLVTLLSMRRRYDLVQVDNLPDFLVFTAALPKLRGARVVLFMLELMPEMVATRLRLRARHPLVLLAARLEAMATGRADAVIAVSETCSRVLQGRGVAPDKLAVVPGSVSAPPPRSAAVDLPSHPYVVTLATLIPRYGVDLAVRAMARLRVAWPELRLVVLGEGEQLTDLTALAEALGVKDRVLFLGYLPWEAAMAWARGASVGLVPVISDGYGELILPTKLLEFAALGVPAVCSRLPAIVEHFPRGSVAYFEPGDEGGLAAQVDALLRDPQHARNQAHAARHAALDLSWERVGPRYADALRRCLDPRSRQRSQHVAQG